MRTARLVGTSAAAMRRHRLRSAFMMLGSLVGVASLSFVLTVGRAGQRKLLSTVRQLFGPSSLVVTGGGGFFMGGPRGEAARLTLDDAATLADALPDVQAWDPMQVVPEAALRRGDASATARMLGQSERAPEVWQRGTVEGEFFDASAVSSSARVAVVGTTVVRTLFPGEDPLGQDILVGSVPFRVIGVLEPLGTDIHGMDRDNEVVVPISTAMRRVMNVDVIRAVKLVLRDPQRIDAAAEEVTRLLRERHGLAEGQPSDFTLMTSAAIQQMLARVERVLFLYLPLVAGLALLTGGAVAATLMLSAVSERTAEIGLRRAVGARPRDIRLQFLAETALVAALGGLAGALMGSALALLLASRLGLEVGLSLPALVLGPALALVTGLVSGYLPAQRAARLEPAMALR